MNKNRLLIVSFLLSLIIAVLVWGALLSFTFIKANKISEMRSGLAGENDEETGNEISSFLSGSRISVEKINSYAVRPVTIISFIEELETLAKHTGVRFDLARLEENKEKTELEMQATISGSLEKGNYMIKFLENSPRLIIVRKASLSLTPADKKQTFWTMQIDASVKNFKLDEKD